MQIQIVWSLGIDQRYVIDQLKVQAVVLFRLYCSFIHFCWCYSWALGLLLENKQLLKTVVMVTTLGGCEFNSTFQNCICFPPSPCHACVHNWASHVYFNKTKENNLDGCSANIILELIPNIVITAVSSSDGFFKQEDSTQHPLDGAHSGLESEDVFLRNSTSYVLHPGFVASNENENNLDKETFHTGISMNNE